MQVNIYGISFPHAPREFCARQVFDHYTVCSFETPFLYEKDGVLLPGKPGDILINTPGHAVYHGPRQDMAQGFVNDWFYIHGDDFGALLTRYPLPVNEPFSVGQGLFLRKYAHRIHQEFHSGHPGEAELMECILTEMVIDLHRAYLQENLSRRSPDSIAAVQKAVFQNPGYPWTLSEMAQRSGYCVSRFSELYSAAYGTSPMDHVLAARVDLAKQLLQSGQATVSRAAELCGFNTVNYFSKYFKQVTGLTPTEYMKKDRRPY